jgi:hypothetical protein
MVVEQRLRQSLFGDISSMLRMYKTSTVAMLFAEFYFRFNGLKKMKIKSSSISYYRFSSCLRSCLLVKTLIRHSKTVQKAPPDTLVSCRRTRCSKKITPNSIAACARKLGVSGQFDSQKRPKNQQKLLCSQYTSTTDSRRGQTA